jgi:hypothetical protein
MLYTSRIVPSSYLMLTRNDPIPPFGASPGNEILCENLERIAM